MTPVSTGGQQRGGNRNGLHAMVRRYLRFRALRNPHLALAGLDFWRCHEFSWLFRWLEGSVPRILLDVGGGGSLLGPFLEKALGCRSLLLDLDPKLVRRFGGSWRTVQSASYLGLETGSVDLSVVTSLLHILPHNGDSLAMSEAGRVLAPGGMCFLSTTWAKRYDETGPDTNPWGLVERWYDQAALDQRIVSPSGLTPVRTEFFGDARTRKMATAWYGSVFYRWSWAKRLFGWRQVGLAAAAEKRDSHDPSDACNVCLLLQKPPDARPPPGVLE